jgi:hypothetical protein
MTQENPDSPLPDYESTWFAKRPSEWSDVERAWVRHMVDGTPFDPPTPENTATPRECPNPLCHDGYIHTGMYAERCPDCSTPENTAGPA